MSPFFLYLFYVFLTLPFSFYKPDVVVVGFWPVYGWGGADLLQNLFLVWTPKAQI